MGKEILAIWMKKGMISIPQILMTHYRKIGLDEVELILILQVISFLEEGKDFPTPEELSERMTISADRCAQILKKLIQQQCLAIEEGHSEDHIRYEKYSLKPLWLKLADELVLDQKEEELTTMFVNENNLYTIFEQEFGRPLSPLECETLAMWIDQDEHDASIIKAALREAVISGKLNFRYIDRILFEWKKNNIQTVEQARQQGNKFRQYQRKQIPNKKAKSSKEVPIYNWLEQ